MKVASVLSLVQNGDEFLGASPVRLRESIPGMQGLIDRLAHHVLIHGTHEAVEAHERQAGDVARKGKRLGRMPRIRFERGDGIVEGIIGAAAGECRRVDFRSGHAGALPIDDAQSLVAENQVVSTEIAVGQHDAALGPHKERMETAGLFVHLGEIPERDAPIGGQGFEIALGVLERIGRAFDDRPRRMQRARRRHGGIHVRGVPSVERLACGDETRELPPVGHVLEDERSIEAQLIRDGFRRDLGAAAYEGIRPDAGMTVRVTPALHLEGE